MTEAQGILAEPLYVNALRKRGKEGFDAVGFGGALYVRGEKTEFTRQILSAACNGVSRVGGTVKDERLRNIGR